MSPTDEQIERLITDCKLMGDALIADGQEQRAAHVLNAMLDLIRARSEAVLQARFANART